jgi:RNA polymerase sigma-70 factor (ECF subfamily)
MSTDEELMARAQGGDHEAFGELVERYRSTIYSLSYKIVGDADEAQDLTQDTFVGAYEKISTFRPGNKVEPWLKRIATNLCIDWCRKQARAPCVQSLDAPLYENEDGTVVTLGDILTDEGEGEDKGKNDPVIIALWNEWYENLPPEEKTLAEEYIERGDSRLAVIQKIETWRDVRECRKELNEGEEQVIKGIFDEGKTPKQVADEMGITEQRVSQIKKTALETLRECLRAKGHHVNQPKPRSRTSSANACRLKATTSTKKEEVN